MKTIPRTIFPVIVIFILVLAYFYKIIFQGYIFLFGDAYYYYSVRVLIYNSLKNFTLPFWTQYLNCGFPLMANPEAGVFDPLNILFLYFLGPIRGFNYLICAYFFMAAVFMFFYCRSLKLDSFSALFTAIIFTFGGAFLGRLVHLPMIFSASFMPLTFWMINLYFTNGHIKYIFLAGLAMGVSFLPGHPQIAVYAAMASIFYFLFQASAEIKKDFSVNKILKYLFLISVIVFIAIGISAIRNIPTLEFAQLSNRAGKYGYQTAKSISFYPKHLITYIFPYFYGSETVGGKVGYWGKGSFWELYVYMGILPFIFLLAGLFSFKKDKRYKFFCFLSFLALMLAFGKNTWVFFIFYKLIPFFRYFKDPCRFVIIMSFGTAILAGLGLDRIINDEQFLEKFLNRLTKISLFLIFTLIILNLIFYRYISKGINFADFYTQFPLFLFISGIALLFLNKRKKINKQQLFVLVIIVTILDLFIINYSQNIPQKTSLVTMEPESVKFIKKDKAFFRVFNIGPDFPYGSYLHKGTRKVPFYVLYGIPSANLAGPLYLVGHRNLLMDIEDSIPPRGTENFSIDIYLNLLKSLNVKYIASSLKLKTGQLKILFDDGVVRVYENQDVAPRVSFVPLDQSGGESLVKINSYTDNRVILEVESDSPGSVVLNDTYYPGWKVFVDGKEKPLLKANSVMRAIFVEGGRHKIEFSYGLPISVRFGLIISLISLCVVISFIFFDKDSQKKPRP